ncbi:MAG TPA: hypothetical protein VFO89_14400, partial [Thermoanaerobaculia bacterium]|nr:hypothetical protein [Thermoanaerobaculia bacterium]
MSAQPQPRNPTSPQPPAGTAAPSPAGRSFRITVAMLLAALLGVGMLHWVLVERSAALTEGRAARAAMIGARAVADVATALGGEGEALGPALRDWQKAHETVRAVRVANIENRTIEASTFAEDLKIGETPRRMQREEKPLYDLGQELRADA